MKNDADSRIDLFKLNKLIISKYVLINSIVMKNIHNFLYKKNRQQQIKGFYYVARFKSISKAAKEMNLTQSTVTLQIQSLERDLEFKLINRDTKPISLTEDGANFYEVVCPIMQEFESAIEKFLNRRKEQSEKKIEIAVHHIAISYLMPKIISHFKKSNPEAKIIVRNIPISDAIERLKEGSIDLAFYPNLVKDPEIEHIDTVSYDPILIMNKNHPLVKKEIKSLKDLKDFDLIRIDRGLIALPLFEEAVKKHGLSGSVEFENGNWEMLKHFVKENDFVAIVSTICLDNNDGDLFTKNLSNFFPAMGYSIAYKKGQFFKIAIENFIDSIKVVDRELTFSNSSF